jgi:phage recombination protein Bet
MAKLDIYNYEGFKMSLSVRNDIAMDVWVKNFNEVKQIYGKNLTDGEFQTFVNLGKSTGLNPFLREIWAVKYGSAAAQIFIGRDGYRRSAQSHPQYDYHHVDAVYSNDDFHFDLVKGEVNHVYNFKDRGKLVGAYCLVKKRNSSKPIFVFVDVQEYNTSKSVWADKPATMIKKVAEAQGLRMAFQELFAGTYEESENWVKTETPVYSKVYNNKMKVVESQMIEVDGTEELDLNCDITKIESSYSLEDLENNYKNAYKYWAQKKDKERLKKIIECKDKRKSELNVEEFKKEFDSIDAETGEIQ